MSFLQLKSTNPDFSFIIRKNPASGMQAKKIRQGVSFGWFSGEDTYNIYFKDSDTEVSYKAHPDDCFEYLNTTRYSSASFVLSALSDYFASAVKAPDPKDIEGFDHEVMINLINLQNPKYLTIFTEYFKNYSIVAEMKATRNYQLRISTRKSLRQLLNFTNLFCIFNVLKNEKENLYITEDIVSKYLKCMEETEAPYFVQYVFKVNLLYTPTLFKQFSERLNKDPSIIFKYGSTHIQRRDAVKSLLSFDMDIVDVGCGEGFYALPFAKALKNHTYHAIDIDPVCLDTVGGKGAARQLENLKVYPSFDEFESVVPYVALVVEVIEHMPLEAAGILLGQILQDPHCKMLILTTPNKDFNKYYNFDDEDVRHDDHCFEFTEQEFREFVGGVFAGMSCEYLNIGDSIEGVTPTQGVVVRR